MIEELASADTELRSANLPRRFVGLSLDDFEENDDNTDALRAVRGYITHLPRRIEEGRGLCITGPPQRGKTMLASIVLTEALERVQELSGGEQVKLRLKIGTATPDRLGYPGYFVTLAQYVRAHLRMFSLRSMWERSTSAVEEMEEYRQWDRLLNALRDRVQLLVLDDVGKEYRTDTGFAEGQFDYLIRQRQHYLLPTIFTANNPPEDWPESYHESVVPFVKKTCTVVEIKGRRRTRKTGGKRVGVD